MKRILKCIILMFVTLLVSCSAPSSAPAAVSESEKAVKEMAASLKLSDRLEKEKERIVRGKVFDGEAVCSQMTLYTAVDEADASRIGVFISDDTALTETCLESYLAAEKKQMSLTHPDQVFMLSNAVLRSGRGVTVLVVCENIEEAKRIVNAYFGEE